MDAEFEKIYLFRPASRTQAVFFACSGGPT
jgi:hypothetical protein